MQNISLQTIHSVNAALHSDAEIIEEMFPVEYCQQCSINYTGRFCENCAEGFYRLPGGLDCIACSCSNLSESCDPHTGECTSCRGSSTGSNCESCIMGFYGDPGMNIPCQPCECGGIVEATCELDVDGNQTCTTCPVGMDGRNCEMCADGYYNLQSGIGCQGWYYNINKSNLYSYYTLQSVIAVRQQSVPSVVRMELACVLKELLARNVMSVILNTQVQIIIILLANYLIFQSIRCVGEIPNCMRCPECFDTGLDTVTELAANISSLILRLEQLVLARAPLDNISNITSQLEYQLRLAEYALEDMMINQSNVTLLEYKAINVSSG